MIAATAEIHSLVLSTRDVSDFRRLNVDLQSLHPTLVMFDRLVTLHLGASGRNHCGVQVYRREYGRLYEPCSAKGKCLGPKADSCAATGQSIAGPVHPMAQFGLPCT